MSEPSYPRLAQLGITVHRVPRAHVKADELHATLDKHGMSREAFSEFFGVQTCPVVDGVTARYPHDVEAVLERMISGKLTGTQLFWD